MASWRAGRPRPLHTAGTSSLRELQCSAAEGLRCEALAARGRESQSVKQFNKTILHWFGFTLHYNHWVHCYIRNNKIVLTEATELIHKLTAAGWIVK